MSTNARTACRAVGLAGLLAAVAVAAGCGSDSDSDSSSGSSSTSTAKGTPVKLVAFVDDTGPNNGKQGDSIPVLEAWVTDANASGGVAGHPVTVEVEDTQGNPSKAATAVQKAIADESVVGVISVDASTESGSIKALSKAGMPVIGGVSYDPGVWGATKGNRYLPAPALPGVYQVTTAFPATIAAYIAAAQQNKLKRMVSISFSPVPASKQATDLANVMAKTVGMEASSLTVDASAPNFTADCLKITQQKADYVIFALPPELTGRVMRDCNTQGYTGAYGLAAGGVNPDSYTKAGSNKVIGALASAPWYTDTPAAKRFVSVMNDNDVSEPEWQSAVGPAAWTTMELFRNTLEANKAKLPKTVRREDVLAAYGAVKDETLDGTMPGPATYTKGDVSPPKCYWLFTYENGEFSGSADASCPPRSLGAG